MSWRPLGPLLGRLGQSWEGLGDVLEASGVVFGGLGGVHARRLDFRRVFTRFLNFFPLFTNNNNLLIYE